MKKNLKENQEINPIKITNVFENFKLVKHFIIGLSGICITLIICFSFVYLKLHTYNLEHAFKINTKGELIPMEVVKLRELYEIEAKDHIRTFVEAFFDYDQFNYQKK